ncbi:MAG: hypothetical protein AVDCRST_MAG69-2892 [uncultured Solirubrobacteraceae bacterium]|uniref:Uncharacterized protein n=1 Tax=uncultured Solirubrobacteraceae bacterium TaxID=1162706 RepID=A0A6J4TAT7_9ACTN|nr:MAG: hypothetical protein AVDCRST_MAG69-2892 [uncultured Solirubrobacteraceae bacterium]
MSAWMIIGLVLLILVALAVGGAIAQRRRMEETRAGFEAHLDRANLDLASAHAKDKGWDPQALEQAVRAALAAERPDLTVTTLTLVQVVDRPGMGDDEAHYRVGAQDRGELLVTMVRRGDGWMAQRIES